MSENADPAVVEVSDAPPTPIEPVRRGVFRRAWPFALTAVIAAGVGSFIGRLFPPFVINDVFWKDFLTSAGFGGLAAFLAALIALCAAWYTSHRSAQNAAADRNQRDVATEDDRLQREVADQRSQWWARFTWATERALDPTSRDVGVASMIGLVGHPWASAQDADIAIAVADVLDQMDTEATESSEEKGEA